jgi:hypothetical protein
MAAFEKCPEPCTRALLQLLPLMEPFRMTVQQTQVFPLHELISGALADLPASRAQIFSQMDDMAFINTTLWGIPTRVIHGNALSMECWAAWSNIHYIMPWLPLALRARTPEAMEQGQPPRPAEVERIKVSLGQQELTLE